MIPADSIPHHPIITYPIIIHPIPTFPHCLCPSCLFAILIIIIRFCIIWRDLRGRVSGRCRRVVSSCRNCLAARSATAAQYSRLSVPIAPNYTARTASPPVSALGPSVPTAGEACVEQWCSAGVSWRRWGECWRSYWRGASRRSDAESME